MTLPSKADILSDLAAILSNRLGVSPSTRIDEATQFFSDLGLASIDAVVLSEAIQEHYGQLLPFDQLMAEIGRRTHRDLSIGELIAFIKTNL